MYTMNYIEVLVPEGSHGFSRSSFSTLKIVFSVFVFHLSFLFVVYLVDPDSIHISIECQLNPQIIIMGTQPQES